MEHATDQAERRALLMRRLLYAKTLTDRRNRVACSGNERERIASNRHLETISFEPVESPRRQAQTTSSHGVADSARVARGQRGDSARESPCSVRARSRYPGQARSSCGHGSPSRPRPRATSDATSIRADHLRTSSRPVKSVLPSTITASTSRAICSNARCSRQSLRPRHSQLVARAGEACPIV